MTTLAVSPALQSYSRTTNPTPPSHLGTRYDATGTFLPEPGNTIVCHLESDSVTDRVLRAARAMYQTMPEADHLAFTAPESLHMTLFQGIIEYRRTQPYWPTDIAADTPIDTMTEVFLERLAPYAGNAPFKVEVIDALPTGLTVRGVTAEDRQIMAAWRNDLADLLGYRHPDHETYEFHITFAYVRQRFDDAALPAWQQMLDEALAMIRTEAPILELRAPAFCSFIDMNWFEELLPLA